MSQIKSKDTKPELLVRKFLFSRGFRYRLHDRRLAGSPDIVLPKYKTLISINGCFWHGHRGCKDFKIPKTRTEWWTDKIKTNASNDKRNILTNSKEGWNVITIWACQLKSGKVAKTLQSLTEKIV